MDLNWGNKNNENLEFPPKYWTYNINDYSQFSQGDHSVTKAFEHYLGLTDDYDFCMGPEEEGQPLAEQEYQDRVWGVYAKTAGEIYLLKSRKDYIGWEEEIRLTYAPSGSRKPNIIFDKNGHYRIVLEITPAGGQPEVWLMEYPYTDSAVRKLFNGSNPVIIRDFYEDIYIFYQPNDNKTQIEYRSSKDNYETTYIADRTVSEREVEPLAAFPVKIDSTNHIALFYYRKDDWQPIKYCITSPVILPTETMNTHLEVQINWEEYTFDISFLVVDLLTQEIIEGAEVTFADRTVITGEDGIAEFPNAGVDFTLVEIVHSDYEYSSFNINITEDTQITAELLGDLELTEGLNTDINLSVEWEDMRRTLTFEITDGENPIEDAVVNIAEKTEMTNADGVAIIENIIAGQYEVNITAETFKDVDMVIDFEEDIVYDIEMQPDFDGHLIEEVGVSVNIEKLEWENMTYIVNFEVKDYETDSLLEGASVEFNNESKTTDSNGVVTFYNVLPYPTVEDYSFVVNYNGEETSGSVVIQGNEETKEITIPVQFGLEIYPNSNIEETSVGVELEILWLEVEE